MTTLSEAIERSQSHNEIAQCEFRDGDEADLCAALGAMYDGEIDSVRENDGTIDVWGYSSDAGDGDMDWRLNVTLTGD